MQQSRSHRHPKVASLLQDAGLMFQASGNTMRAYDCFQAAKERFERLHGIFSNEVQLMESRLQQLNADKDTKTGDEKK